MYGLVDAARDFATFAHTGQQDKAGRPYIGHPAAVAGLLADQEPWVQAIGWLHDVVEDTSVSLTMVRILFGDRIADGVDSMNRREGETRNEYLNRLVENPVAVIVKRADVAHNTDPERLAELDPETRDRLIAKYRRTLAVLDRCCSHRKCPGGSLCCCQDGV